MATSKPAYYKFDLVLMKNEIREVEDATNTLIKFIDDTQYILINNIEIQGIEITEDCFDDFGFYYSRSMPELKLNTSWIKEEFWGRGTNHGNIYGVIKRNNNSYIPFAKTEKELGKPVFNEYIEVLCVHELQQWWRNNAEGELVIKRIFLR